MASGVDPGDAYSDPFMVPQWVHKVTRASSEWDVDTCSAQNLIGPPKVKPELGEYEGTWAPDDIEGDQFLELEFLEPVFVTGIEIYEVEYAGGIRAVKGRTENGNWRVLWETTEVESINDHRIFTPPLKDIGCQIRHIRLEIDCSGCVDEGQWIEIDAVKLKGRRFLSGPPPSIHELATDYAKLVNDQEYSDVTFLVQERAVYGHKAILCARSDYFSRMIKEHHSEDPINIVGVNHDDFLAVLRYLYSTKLPDNYDTIRLTKLWRDKYNMDDLKMNVMLNINFSLNDDNVVDTYVAATNIQPVIEDVRVSCIYSMASGLSKIVNTKSFTSLPQHIMLEIIQKVTAQLQVI